MKYRQLKILTGILGETMANKIYGSDDKLKASEIPQSSTISNFILDENVNLEDVRRFFKVIAWAKFMKIINYKRVCVLSVIFLPLIQTKTCFTERFILTAFQSSTGKLVLLIGTRSNLFFKVFMIFLES